MPEVKDLTGMRFGRWLVLSRAENIRYSGSSITAWNCKCACGNEKVVTGRSLRNGQSKSCGCLRDETASKTCKSRSTHGMTGSRLYRIWNGMIRRCETKSASGYDEYGARGITVCSEWKKFENFYKWALQNGYTDELTLDRKDNDGNYEPNNCRWATYSEQNKNRRKFKRGKKKT